MEIVPVADVIFAYSAPFLVVINILTSPNPAATAAALFSPPDPCRQVK